MADPIPPPDWWDIYPEQECQHPADYTTRPEDHSNWHLHKIELLLKQVACILLDIEKKIK